MKDSVQPIVDSGLMELIDTDAILADERDCTLRLIPTHGHTPGHCSVMVHSKGERAIITGDWIHHPIQMSRFDISTHPVDSDCVAARNTRIRMLDELADTDVLVLTTHFCQPQLPVYKER
eukprot:TRINITY_DN6042_c0_g1_i1.p1 TRINITY_DN6042_c0_g1~~TRINITY_DN6042_c0_g1_i1.p1  ORF type:complete len:120 (+),score=14.84 TRINITY_DN6042_c0_g1_i1:102-461(+)